MFQKVKRVIKRLLKEGNVNLPEPVVTGFSCPVCKNNNVEFKSLPYRFFREFEKYQFIHSIFLFETINLEFYSCSKCGANDRCRLYALYFDIALKKVAAGQKLSVLDIAPAQTLTKYLEVQDKLVIRTADLYMEGVDDKVDITKMDIYPDNNFDVFICSHVLEHIDEDETAMSELYRVLKPGGWGIAMVPVNLGLEEDYEDPSVNDIAGRWKYFGQDDHVRMYSKKGFVSKLTSAGFKVNELGADFFGKEIFDVNGIQSRSVLYIVSK